jgi:hypothetical protein
LRGLLSEIYSLTPLLVRIVLGGVDAGSRDVRTGCQAEPFLVYVENRRLTFVMGCVNVCPVDRLAVLLSVVMLLVYIYTHRTVAMYTDISIGMFLS